MTISHHRSLRSRLAALGMAMVVTTLATLATIVSWTTSVPPVQAAPVRAALGVGQLEQSPAGRYASGQVVTIRLQATPGKVLSIRSGLCPSGVDLYRLDDVAYRNQTCSQITPIDGVRMPSGSFPADGNGLIEFRLRVPQGTATATTGSGTFPCDVDHSCLVPFSVQTPQGSVDFMGTMLFAYAPSGDGQVAGACAPTTPGEVVRAAAPDRLSQQWVTWTVDQCGGKAPATTTSFGDESLALTQFSSSGVDLAYGATPETTPGFVTGGHRNAVYVPVVLNSVGLGLLSHRNVPSSVPDFPISKELGGFTMTQPEVASLVSPDAPDGLTRIGSPLELGFARRNPDYLAKGDNRSFALTSAVAGSSATTLFLSAYLSAQAPDQFAYPNIAKYGSASGKPFGTFSDFNALTESQSLLSLNIGVPSLRKSVYDATADVTSRDAVVSLRSFAYLTDTATLGQLDVAPVGLQSSDGSFVAPTPATMQAAVPTMTTTAEGTRAPDPKASAPGAYPLTYVEYAVVPGDPILCSQATRISDWLRWVTTTGQDHLTTGLAPLTADLQQQAAERLAPLTASCTPDPATPGGTGTPTPPPNTPAATGGSGSGGFGGSSGGSSSPGFGSTSFGSSDPIGSSFSGGLGSSILDNSAVDATANGGGSGTPTALADPQKAQLAASQVKIPAFDSPAGPAVLLPVLAIPLVGALLSGAAWFSARDGAGTGRSRRRRGLAGGPS